MNNLPYKSNVAQHKSSASHADDDAMVTPIMTNWNNRLVRAFQLAVVVLFMTFTPILSQAKASAETAQTQEQQSAEEPDNIIDYAIQQIQQDNPETEEQDPTRPLLAENELTGEFNEAYYVLNTLNSGLPALSTPPNLETPLATLEFFNSASMQKDFALAAYALNLNLLPEADQKNEAADLAEKLDYLMTEKSLYAFDELPDRSDGLIEPSLGTDSPVHGIPRRSIKLGSIDYKNRSVPLYLERIRVGEQAPVWVFSSQSVANINALYDMHKPADFERFLPKAMTTKVWGVSVWEVLTLFLFMLATMGIGYLISIGVTKLVSVYSDVIIKRTKTDQLSLRSKGLTDLLTKITVPLTVTLSFSMMFALVSGSLPRVDAIATSTRAFIWLCLVVSGLWLGVRIINFFANRYQDYHIDSLSEEEFNTQRIRMTYVSIFRRIFIFVMVRTYATISLGERNCSQR